MRMPQTGRTKRGWPARGATIARLATGFAFGRIVIGYMWTQAGLRVNLTTSNWMWSSSVACLLLLSVLSAGSFSGFRGLQRFRFKAVQS